MICHFVEFSEKVPQRQLTEIQLAMSTLPEALEEKHCVDDKNKRAKSNKDVKVSVSLSQQNVSSEGVSLSQQNVSFEQNQVLLSSGISRPRPVLSLRCIGSVCIYCLTD